jgi:hypothetical protein
LSGTGNANRAPTLPYDLVYIDNAVLAAVQLSQAVGSIPISFGTASITGDPLDRTLRRQPIWCTILSPAHP